eukprot:COSAG01_NODE_1437_length_10311_cov_11.678613_6_plen_194_part_00
MICLGQKAEDAEDENTYVDAWCLYQDACELAGTDSVPSSADVPSSDDDEQELQAAADTRTRNGLTGDTGRRKWVTTSDHYKFRNVKLRHLNAMEFFQTYVVKPRAKPVKATTAAQADGRGRKQQEHPLFASHVCVLRAKFVLPVVTGGFEVHNEPGGPRLGNPALPGRLGPAWVPPTIVCHADTCCCMSRQLP